MDRTAPQLDPPQTQGPLRSEEDGLGEHPLSTPQPIKIGEARRVRRGDPVELSPRGRIKQAEATPEG